jgi:hypothetical protein
MLLIFLLIDWNEINSSLLFYYDLTVPLILDSKNPNKNESCVDVSVPKNNTMLVQLIAFCLFVIFGPINNVRCKIQFVVLYDSPNWFKITQVIQKIQSSRKKSDVFWISVLSDFVFQLFDNAIYNELVKDRQTRWRHFRIHKPGPW